MNLKEHLELIHKGLKNGWDEDSCPALDDLVSLWRKALPGKIVEKKASVDHMHFVHYIDAIKLRRMSRVSTLILGPGSTESRNALAKFRHGTWTSVNEFPLILCTTDGAYDRTKVQVPRGNGLMLSYREIGRILESNDPSASFRAYISKQIPYGKLMPFSTTLPVSGNMFFGRNDEVSKLKDQDDVSYAVSSSGLSGKTSLLRQVQWELRREQDPRYARTKFVDLYTCDTDLNEIAKRIARGIQYNQDSHKLTLDGLESFIKRIPNLDPSFRDGPVHLYIDEVDECFGFDKRMGYPVQKILRSAIQQNHLRLTIVGRDTPGKIVGDVTNPFHGRIRKMVLGALKEHDARMLFAEPLNHMGITLIDKEKIVAQILEQSEGTPSRLQMWGLEICEFVEKRRDRRFTLANLDELMSAIV